MMSTQDKVIALLTAWNLESDGESGYTIANTHYAYLKFISENYLKVYLVSSVRNGSAVLQTNYRVSDFSNVTVIPLPEVKSYINSLLNFRAYYRALKSIRDKVDVCYCRVPDPFAWMSKLVIRKKNIMHFVGDAIDTTRHNEKWGFIKKQVMIAGYCPEYLMTLLAARKSTVYTNGVHLARKLSRFGVSATPVISSTVSENSLCPPTPRENNTRLRLINVGYIRYAKGIKLLMSLFLLLKEKYPDFIFDIVGNGEMMEELRMFVEENSLTNNVIMHGHIDNREDLNRLMRSADLFIFPSLSEGSPRVVVEAMSEGVAVVSTPVGSLPDSFEDGVDIRFFGFNDAQGVMGIIEEFMNDAKPFDRQREMAYIKVKENYTIESFLSKIFSYEA